MADLHAAIASGDPDLVRTLLAAGADVALADADGTTALTASSEMGQLECVRALLKSRADVAQADEQGCTALMAASREGRFECVRALLEAGVEVGANVDQYARDGSTALIAASRRGHLECVCALLEAGADVARADSYHADVRHSESDGHTPLMWASQEGHLECVRALLEADAHVAQADQYGYTALMAASRMGHVECARALLEAGADVMRLCEDLICALEFACRSLSTLQLLCAYAPSRQAVRAHPMPVDRVSPECAQWLAATSRWTSPLHHFEFLSLERVRALLVEGADVRAGDGAADAPTPLSLAAARLLLRGDSNDDVRAALIVRAASPWSPQTHALFPAAAKARGVALVRIGWLLARWVQSRATGQTVEVAFRDVWLGHVMPQSIERSSG